MELTKTFFKRIFKHSARIVALLLSIVFIWLSLNVGQSSGLMTRIEYLLYDWRFNLMLPITKRSGSDHKIAIIDIDEDSVVEQGRFPWSRHTIAKLVDRLGEAGVVVTAFDVVFSEAEVNPVDQLEKQGGDRTMSLATEKQWQTIAQSVDADQRFSQSLSEQDVVLGFFFQDEGQYKNGQLPSEVFSIPDDWADQLVVTKRPGFTGNLPVLQDAASGGGFVTMFPDFDGTVRRTPLVIRYEDKLYPSLSLAAAMRYLFLEEVEPKVAEVGNVLTMIELSVSEFPAPTDPQGFVRVPYQGGAYTYPYISATDVIEGRIEPGVLEGAVVFVGTSAIGLADLRSTPMGPQYPGVEVHANILDALLSGGFSQKPDWEAGATVLQLLVISLLIVIWLPRFGPQLMLATALTIITLTIAFNFYLWVNGIDLPYAGSLLLTITLTMVFVADGFLKENASRKMLKGMFDQYVPPAHIDQMMNNPDAYSFSGESKELTVLFSDIRSFTNISESLSAQELKLMLNTYFTPITKEIFDFHGTIDKYVGDMVMAFWGAPIDDPNHRNNAVMTALRMQEVTEQLKPMFKSQGLPEINIGVGVNTGHMNVGDMGSSYRRSYTVLGDAVNLGSRLESITKFYGAKVLIGEETYDHLTGFVCRFVDKIQVKGKEEAIRVYEPLGIEGKVEPHLLEELKQYEIAYSNYLSQDWDSAREAFKTLKENHDLVLYDVYLERIEDLKNQSLPEDWDGTFRHTSK